MPQTYEYKKAWVEKNRKLVNEYQRVKQKFYYDTKPQLREKKALYYRNKKLNNLAVVFNE